MKTVYLKNGQQANLVEQIGNRFVVQRIMTYENYDNEYGSHDVEIEGDEEVVNEIFENPPKQKIDSEITELESKKKTIQEEIQTLKNDKSKLTLEVNSIQRTQIDSERFIINRSDIMKAKEIVLFPKDRVMPIVRSSEDKSMRGLKVSFEIAISDGKERAWGYKLYHEYNDHYSQFLCEKYGILVDPTQEQIDETIVKRLTYLKFDDRQIAYTDDKYLTSEQIKTKETYLATEKQKSIESNKKQIADLKEKIDRLENPDKYLPKS